MHLLALNARNRLAVLGEVHYFRGASGPLSMRISTARVLASSPAADRSQSSPHRIRGRALLDGIPAA